MVYARALVQNGMPWRWDQGRLKYFQFTAIKQAAGVFQAFEGSKMRPGTYLKPALRAATGLEFPPDSLSYPAWRNHARIFKLELLATQVDGRLATTEICSALASGELGADDYIRVLIRRLYFPSPAFTNYDSRAPRVFPLCAVLRLLIARAASGREPSVTAREALEYLAAAGVKGDEPIEAYVGLARQKYRAAKDEERQVREMLIVVGQASFLDWDGEKLWLDAGPEDNDTLSDLEKVATPDEAPRKRDAALEILQLGRREGMFGVALPAIEKELPEDLEFTEGKKVRKEHVRRERNRLLVKRFFETLPQPAKCDLCGADVNARYPWLWNLLEAHHVLPLSSPLRSDFGGTKLSELVPICPNCHRAVHAYYRVWLKGKGQDDFVSADESQSVYKEARSKVQGS